MPTINEEIAEKVMGWHKVQESCFPEAWHNKKGEFTGFFVDYCNPSLPETRWNPEQRVEHALIALNIFTDWSIHASTYKNEKGYLVSRPNLYNRYGPSKSLASAICNALLK